MSIKKFRISNINFDVQQTVSLVCKVLCKKIAKIGIEFILMDAVGTKIQLFCFAQQNQDVQFLVCGQWFKICNLKVFELKFHLQIYHSHCLFLSKNTCIKELNKDVIVLEQFQTLIHLKMNVHQRSDLLLILMRIMPTEPFLTCCGRIVARQKLLVSDGKAFWFLFLWKQQCTSALKEHSLVAFFACKKSKIWSNTIESVGHFIVKRKVAYNKHRLERLENHFGQASFKLSWLKQSITVTELRELMNLMQHQKVSAPQFCLFCGEITEILLNNLYYAKNYDVTQINFLVKMNLKDFKLQTITVIACDEIAQSIFKISATNLKTLQKQNFSEFKLRLKRFTSKLQLYLFELQLQKFQNGEHFQINIYISSVLRVSTNVMSDLKQFYKHFKA